VVAQFLNVPAPVLSPAGGIFTGREAVKVAVLHGVMSVIRSMGRSLRLLRPFLEIRSNWTGP